MVLGLMLPLVSCSSKTTFEPYRYFDLRSDDYDAVLKNGYHRLGEYTSLSSSDIEEIPAKLASIYSYGNARKVLRSTGNAYLTVIPVDFEDYPYQGDFRTPIQAAFFGDTHGNQYVSLAEYYDRASYHRLHVGGEVTEQAFRANETYASLKSKNNASQTKAALTKIYNDAVAWYNELGTGRTLTPDDAVYFVYSAPYSGMDGGTSSRSSMMWAFAVNEPAPIGWSSFHMMHPSSTGQVDAHTFIHEFGHLLGLKDYYDQNSYSELSPCSPLGRMDMMDCSLGEHNAFSKMMLNWAHPYVPDGECTVTLRTSSGNEDMLLLPLTDYNGTPYDEYLLLEFYTPNYLNYADSTLRADVDMSLFRSSGIKAYHVDGRLGLYETRSKNPVAVLNPETEVGGNSLDLYCDNSGYTSGGYATSSKGFLIQLLDASSGSMKLVENYIASDHIEDRRIDGKVAHIRDSLFHVGQGIDASFKDVSFHSKQSLEFGFKVQEITSAYCTINVFPYQK